MTDKQAMILQYMKEIFKTKTAYELYRQVEKLGMVIRKESQKESDPKNKTKSVFSDD